MYSKQFVQSQVDYYRKNLNCGPSRDWNMIHGLYVFWSSKLKEIEE